MFTVLKNINNKYFNSLDYELYIEYKTRVLDYEIDNPKTNIVSILFTPIFLLVKIAFLLVKIAFLLKDIFKLLGIMLLSIPIILKDLFCVIFQISILTIKFYYEKIINLFNVIITIICLTYVSDNMLAIGTLTILMFIYNLFLFKYQKDLIKSILNTNDNLATKNFKFLKLFNIILYISAYFIHDYSKYKILILTGLVSDILYNSLYPIYIYKYSKNIMLLDRYGLSNKIIEIVNSNVTNIIDTKLNYETFNHICDLEDNGNCSKCPCGICYEKLSDAAKLKCGHIYDKKCIRTWALYEYNLNNRVLCPSCRAELI